MTIEEFKTFIQDFKTGFMMVFSVVFGTGVVFAWHSRERKLKGWEKIFIICSCFLFGFLGQEVGQAVEATKYLFVYSTIGVLGGTSITSWFFTNDKSIIKQIFKLILKSYDTDSKNTRDGDNDNATI
jgi:hypothetical protein